LREVTKIGREVVNMSNLCSRCLAKAPEDATTCPKCGAILPLPADGGPLRSVVKFSLIMPLYRKPILRYDAEGLLVDVKTEFTLYVAVRELKQPPILIYDADGYVNARRNEYALARLDEERFIKVINDVPESVLKKVLKAHKIEAGGGDVDDNPLMRLWKLGAVVTPVPRLKTVEFLRGYDWREFVEEIINFKHREVKIDPRLRIVRLTHLMRGIKQSINPHALVVLPGQTGKSEWYKYAGRCEDKVSCNGLIGYADAEGPRPGSLDGSELVVALDQLESSEMFGILRYLLGLMEFGEASVDMAGYTFTIWCTSPLVILSNPIGDPKSNFAVLLEKMCRNPALGRRFGVILYDKKAVRIQRREKEMEKIQEAFSLFRAVEEYAWPEIRKIVDDERVWGWLNQRNGEWIKQALKVIEPIEGENESLYLFLREFVENGWTHIRGGALRAALAMNLDKIALKDYDLSDIIREAEEYLAEILKINFESIKLLATTYQETKEEGDLRAFDMLPTYMKEIVSAIEIWRRSLKEEERARLSTPLKIYLNTLEYKPQTAAYFSEVLKDARKGNPEKYNEVLRSHFQFELKKEEKGIVAFIYSLTPLAHLRVLGNLGILGNLEDFAGAYFPRKEAENEEIGQKNIPLKDFQISQFSQISQKQIEVYRCGECRHYRAGRCALRCDWVCVMPTHLACEHFEPKEEGADEGLRGW